MHARGYDVKKQKINQHTTSIQPSRLTLSTNWYILYIAAHDVLLKKESTMITEIGKELRKLRIDNNERLIDMAQRIDKSSAFISAVEVGKKSPPQGFEDAIIQIYQLASSAAEALRKAADRSRAVFSLTPNSAIGRDTAGLMARKIDTLSEEQFQEIQKILLGKE